MKKTLFVSQIVAMLFLVVSVSSCKKKCEENGTLTYDLSEETRAKVPYSGTETITFIHESEAGTSEVQFTGQGTSKYYASTPGTFDDCNVTIRKQSQDLNFYAPNRSHILYYSITAINETNSEFFVEFKGHKFKEDFNIVGNNKAKGYHAEIEFNGVKYHNVTEMVKQYPNTAARVYYSPEHGFIRFAFDKETWTLKS